MRDFPKWRNKGDTQDVTSSIMNVVEESTSNADAVLRVTTSTSRNK